MKAKTHICVLFFLFFSITALLAQDNGQKKIVNEKPIKKQEVKGDSTGNAKSPLSTGDEINFKDGDGNSLITITDEGTVGSITIPPMMGIPTTAVNKLYNIGSTLYFNGSPLGSGGGATSLNDLSDAKTDAYSVFLGNGAGASDDGSNNNTAVGISALHSNTSGSYNVANGYTALYENTIGNENTATGFGALHDNNNGIENVANGYQALKSSLGDYNTANGCQALFNNTGNSNTANGNFALYSNTTGSDNTASGINALSLNKTGYDNTAIGAFADVSTDGLSNATAIGYNAIVNASNTIQLGNSSITAIYAKVGITATSDSTKKENFLKVDGEKVLDKFRKFRLTSWNFKGDNPKTQRHYGIMAQDFFSAFGHDAMGTIGNDTTISGSDANGINMIAIQALERRTTEQDQRLKKQDQRIKTQDQRIEELEKRNQELSMKNSEIEKQNTEIKNEFESIKLIVNKLAMKREI